MTEMEIRVQYFDCLCRTCMNKVEASSHDGTFKPQQQWLSIFELIEECGALRIAELLSDAVPQIVVQPSDELPKKICTECLQRLLSVYRFQKMCIQSDKQMHELLYKEQTVLKTSLLERAIKCETETNDAETQPLKDWSSTLQNLQQPSMQEPLAEVTVQAIEQEAAQSSAADHLQDNSQLLEYCNDKGEFEEFIKNEPIEDDEANSDYSDGDTMLSTISVTKGEVLPMEFEHQQVNDAVLGEQRTTYAEDKPYECPFCPLRFCSKQNASLHKTIHEGIKPHKCGICGKNFRLKSNLTKHTRIHSTKKPHNCDQCEKRFAQMEELKTHMRTHTGEKPYKCKYCERGFADCSTLNNHLRRHLGKNIYRCKFCPLAFPLKSDMVLHLTWHKNENPDVRERNLKALQEEEDKLVLKFSKEKSKRQSTQEQQQQKLSNKEIKQPSTDVLGEQRTTYAEDKPYECPYCPLRFSYRSGVTTHKVIHEEIKGHKCSICAKKCRQKSDLIRHARIHTKEKPHKCDICEKRFTHMQPLQVHIRKHTGEKPNKCKYCESGFASHSRLNHHLRSHLGENIHRCKFCPLDFPSSAAMRLHLTSHKNEDPEIPCEFAADDNDENSLPPPPDETIEVNDEIDVLSMNSINVFSERDMKPIKNSEEPIILKPRRGLNYIRLFDGISEDEDDGDTDQATTNKSDYTNLINMKERNCTLLTTNMDCWSLLGTSHTLSVWQKKILASKFPRTFFWLLETCAQTINVDWCIIYEQLLTIEIMFAYGIEDLDDFQNYVRFKYNNPIKDINMLVNSYRELW